MKKHVWKSDRFAGLTPTLFSLLANNHAFSQSRMHRFVEMLASIAKPRTDCPVLVEMLLSRVSDQLYLSQSLPTTTQHFNLVPKGIKSYLGRPNISTKLKCVPSS
ncbi:MAG TPA: hypothetical protein VES38_07940 [Methylotenera sp.]|nr:hypothetical protein [Methylotenera sp.]